jgi:hypothetical protein
MSHLDIPLTTIRWQENLASRCKKAHAVVENEANYLKPDEYTKALTKDEQIINAKLCLAPMWSYGSRSRNCSRRLW